MALETFPWREPDVTGVVTAWMQGVAAGQRDEKMRQTAAQQVLSNYQAGMRLRMQREAQERLLRAQEMREALLFNTQGPWVDPYANEPTSPASPTAPVARSRGGAPVAPTLPVSDEAAPADGANVVLGTPTTGGTLIRAANAGANAQLAPALTSADPQTLSLAMANPNAETMLPPLEFPTPTGATTPTPADAVLTPMPRAMIPAPSVAAPAQLSLQAQPADTGAPLPTPDLPDAPLPAGNPALDLLGAAAPVGGTLPAEEDRASAPDSLALGPVVRAPKGGSFGNVTAYGYKGDQFGGPNAKASTTGPNGNKLDSMSFAASPDVEKLLASKGIKFGDEFVVHTPAGSEVRRFDDRTAQDDPTHTWAVDDQGNRIPDGKGGYLRALRGRWDFHADENGSASRAIGGRVIAFQKYSPPEKGDEAAAGDVQTALYRPGASGAAADVLPASDSSDPAQQILARGEAMKRQASADLARRGATRREAQQTLAAIDRQTNAAVLKVESEKPIVKNFADGTSQQYNRQTGQWELLAKKVDPTTKEPLTYQNGLWFSKGGKAFREDENGQLQPVTKTQYGTPEEQIAKDGFTPVNKPGYENVVTNKDGSSMQIWSQGANGKVTYKPFSSAGKIEHVGDTIVRVMPDNTKVMIAKIDKVAGADQKGLTDAMQDVAKAQDELVKAQNVGNSWYSPNRVKTAEDKLAKAQTAVGVYVQKYPFLQETVGRGLPGGGAPAPATAPAPQPSAPAAQAPVTASTGTAGETVYQNEAAARAAGHSRGDIITVINPATGRPQRARLQ